MTQLDVALCLAGATVVVIALLSKPMKRSLLQEPMLAVLMGVAAGPYGLDWLDVSEWGDEITVLEQSARLTLAIGLMGVALRLSKTGVATLWRPVAVLLSFGMLGMWAVSSGIVGYAFGLPIWVALLLGAALTPTDPVVASSIVTGDFAKERLPLRVRDTISFDSGANDGLAYLFVMLPILMIHEPAGRAWYRWLLESLLQGVIGAAALGGAVGYAAARLLRWADDRGMIESISLLGYTVAFSSLTLSAAQDGRPDFNLPGRSDVQHLLGAKGRA